MILKMRYNRFNKFPKIEIIIIIKKTSDLITMVHIAKILTLTGLTSQAAALPMFIPRTNSDIVIPEGTLAEIVEISHNSPSKLEIRAGGPFPIVGKMIGEAAQFVVRASFAIVTLNQQGGKIALADFLEHSINYFLLLQLELGQWGPTKDFSKRFQQFLLDTGLSETLLQVITKISEFITELRKSGQVDENMAGQVLALSTAIDGASTTMKTMGGFERTIDVLENIQNVIRDGFPEFFTIQESSN